MQQNLSKSSGEVATTKELMGRFKRQLIRKDRLASIGALSGGVVHELNNPLAGILALTQMLQQDVPPNSEIQEDLKEIEAAVNKCNKIIKDLLLYARDDQEEARPLSMKEVLETILPIVRYDLRRRNITLTTHHESGLSPVKGNRAQLQQVIVNMIENAAESTKEGGEVIVWLRRSKNGKHVLIEVIDDGIGIREEDHKRIFDPFFSLKPDGEETGLGLSICEAIILEHGGRIEVESQEGKGSLFRLHIPSAQKGAE